MSRLFYKRGRSNCDEKASMFISLYKLFHFLVSVALFAICWFLFRYGSFSEIIITKEFRYDIYVTAFYAVLLYYFSKIYNTYLLGYYRTRYLALMQFFSHLFSALFVIGLVFLAWMKFYFSPVLAGMLVLDILLDCFWSYSANRMFLKLTKTKNAIVVYGSDHVSKSDLDISGKPVERLIAIHNKIYCTPDNLHDVMKYLDQYDVFFAIDLLPECVEALSIYCIEKEKEGYFLPSIEEIIFQKAYHIQSFHEPLLTVKARSSSMLYLFLKRAFDIIASLLGIILFSPLMLLIFAAVRIYDRGPGIYRQTRLTKGGKQFTLYKFRSMIVNAEQNGKAVLSTGEKDSRVTPIGRIIRAARLDELPQLFNILSGDMTIVGPRPERPEIAEQYYVTLPEFKLRLQVKAGLTGYAQVYGKYNTTPEQKLKFDMIYINKMNVSTDIKLMFATFGILFQKESTEGIADDAMNEFTECVTENKMYKE